MQNLLVHQPAFAEQALAIPAVRGVWHSIRQICRIVRLSARSVPEVIRLTFAPALPDCDPAAED